MLCVMLCYSTCVSQSFCYQPHNLSCIQILKPQTGGCQGGGVGGGLEWEAGVSRCKLLYREWINNKVLLYSTGNYIQYPMINHNGKEY